MSRSIAVAVAVAAAVFLAACADAPATRFHTLLAPQALPADAPRPVAWTLAPVTVPARVERPQLVVRAPDDTLAVLEYERWIAPLADEIRAAVAERLAQRLGTEGGSPTSTPVRRAWRVTLTVQRFDSDPARAARIDAAWTAASADAATLRCQNRFEEPVAAGYAALAAGHRRALARLADAVAATLSALDRGEPAQCP